MHLNPYIKARLNNTQIVMLDVVIALIPLLVAGFIAYGSVFLKQIGVALITAVMTELLFSKLLLRKSRSVLDGSAIVTAILLAAIVSPVTPYYIMAFGAFAAILFGKIVWGGLGKNKFNPALLGREFMTVFFASSMTSPEIWKTQDLVQASASNIFPGVAPHFLSDHLSTLVYKTTGAMGEYSVLAIVLGGIYLLIRNRISWHIPFALLATFALLTWIIGVEDLRFSVSGILLGTIFMATDMPSSPTNKEGKLYYGMMIGVAVFIFINGAVRNEYMSYAILILNGFSEQVSTVFKPRPWGRARDKGKIENIFFLSLKIMAVILAVLSLHYYGLLSYLIYTYILYIIVKFSFSFSEEVEKAI